VPDPDVLRLWFVFWLVMVSIVAVFAAFAVGLHELKKPPDGNTVIALVSAVTTAVGTLVGFVAGQKLGAAGKERADNRADAVQERLDAVVETNGDVLREAAGRHPNLFPHLRQTT
jgi:NADPH-dependent curcumin reductase CurA